MDDLDRRLLSALPTATRPGVLELSRRLGVARGTVQARLDRLQTGGALSGFGPYVDLKALGFTVLAFTTLDVVVRKDGCEEQSYRIRRNERPDYGAILFGYYLAVPILWSAQYKDHHSYPFYCEEITAAQ